MNMGLTAERLQKKYGISREDADAFALRSHRNAVRAQAGQLRRRDRAGGGRFGHGQGPVKTTFERDEGPRADTTLEALAKLKPVFHAHGTVTAGNSSQTSDGAAAALVMSDAKARELGLKPMARFVSFRRGRGAAGDHGHRPGGGDSEGARAGRTEARRHRRDRAERSLRGAGAGGDSRRRGWIPRASIVNGGAIALGHPLGCTGAKLTATILREMERATRATAW